MKSLSLNPSHGLQETLQKAQTDVRIALNNSFDTSGAMRAITELISSANIHLSNHKSDTDLRGLEASARWITKMVGIFGLDANAAPPYEGLGWASSATSSTLTAEEMVKPYSTTYTVIKGDVEALNLHSEVLDKELSTDVDAEFASLASSGSRDPEALAMPYLRSINRIRHELRILAPKSSSKMEILSLSDRVRDIDLTNLGVSLDDRAGQVALIKFVPKSEILAMREEKLAKEREKAAANEKKLLEAKRLEAEKAEKAKLPPTEMFKADERFAAWDEAGMPTKTKDGEEVSKSLVRFDDPIDLVHLEANSSNS